MRSILKSVFFLALLMCCNVVGQNVGAVKFQPHRWLKFENGLIISWKSVDAEAKDNQIDVYDLQGHTLASMNILRLIPDARMVTISDITARIGGPIAVAAVYASKAGVQTVRSAATLLLFDFQGHLSSAFSLEPSKEIERLVLDGESNIWTLTAHADDKDPSSMPMVVEYTKEGKISKEILPRSMFPLHAAKTQANSEIGSPAMGVDSSGVWFWLPGSTELVTVPARDGGPPNIVKTGIPTEIDKKWVPLNMFRQSSGSLVVQVRDLPKRLIAYYIWSPTSKLWAQFKPGGCENDWLIGVTESEQVYVRHDAGQSQFCLFAGEQPLSAARVMGSTN